LFLVVLQAEEATTFPFQKEKPLSTDERGLIDKIRASYLSGIATCWS